MTNEVTMERQHMSIRWGSLVLLGILAVIFGILIILFPQISALILIELIGIFILILSFSAIMMSAVAPGGMKGSGLLVILGVIGFFFGIATMLSPVIMGEVIFVIIGIVLFIVGLINLVFAVTEKHMVNRGLFALQGIISVVLGLAIIGLPLIGGAVAIVIIAAYFVFWGVVNMFLGYSIRKLEA